jgi:hypothetical protein
MENANLKTELAPVKSQLSKAETAANALEIKAAVDLTIATEILSRIKIAGNEIKERKESFTRPATDIMKRARELFAPLEAQYARAEKIVKYKIQAYHEKDLIEAQKKTEVIEKKVEAGKMGFDKAAEKIESITPGKTVEAKTGAVQFRKVKEVIIEDAIKLPREYLVPDMIKIRKVALAGITIPGVKVVEKEIVAGITKGWEKI